MTSLAEKLHYYVTLYNSNVATYVLMFLLVPTGIYFTLRSRFTQLFRMRHAFDIALGRFDDPDDEGDISHFQALCAALSATVGTGNIAGVALAIYYGGPGALVWMWLTGFVGMATKFGECTLSQMYREIDEDGTAAGGPMYYIRDGLSGMLGKGAGLLAFLFAVATIICSFGTGNMAQSNSIVAGLTQALSRVLDWPKAASSLLPNVLALATAFIVGLVIIGGIKRIGEVASKLVPFMAVFYVASAVAVILVIVKPPVAAIIVLGVFISWYWPSRSLKNRGRKFALTSVTWAASAVIVSALMNGPLFSSLKLIISSAFSGRAAVGGFGGATFLMAVRWGLARGLFSNEAGQGSAPIAHAAAKTKYPVREGFVAMIGPFIDTLIICTMTALVIIFTGTWTSGLKGVAMTARSFETGLGAIHPALAPVGFFMVTVGLFLFAVSTAISWAYYGEQATKYLLGKKAVTPYRYVYCAFVYIGGITSLKMVWDFCDAAMSLMCFPNLVALLLLSPVVFKALEEYKEPGYDDA